jgi:hypothetical protein
VLWSWGLAEVLGARLDDPGFVYALRDLGRGLRQFRADLAEWWRTTKRELRDAWRGSPS